MVGKLGICFLAMIMGSAAFLVAGVACFWTISQLQYRTLQARATQAAETYQVSSRAKNVPLTADPNMVELRYAQLTPY